MLLLLGSSDGTTEVVRDTLFQRYLPQRLRACLFAISGSVQNAGMVLGIALAPILGALTTSTHTLDAVALGCVVGAALAAAALLKRPTHATLPRSGDHSTNNRSRPLERRPRQGAVSLLGNRSWLLGLAMQSGGLLPYGALALAFSRLTPRPATVKIARRSSESDCLTIIRGVGRGPSPPGWAPVLVVKRRLECIPHGSGGGEEY
jgi:MFS family permease